MASVVVITGATAGVGRATAIEFAKRGASIGLLARGEEGLQQTKQDVERHGGKAVAIATDVAEYQQVETAANQVEKTFGPIDIWVNNAMTTVFAPLEEISPDEYRRATEVTYLGTVYGTMVALSRMKAHGKGTIVQVGSALAYRAIPLQAPYCGAKHAIRGFTDSLRSELLHQNSNISITMVQLPGLNTPQFSWCKAKLPNHPQPVPPIFQPEVAAEAIEWASRHRRREVIVGGSALKAIWGNKFFPGYGDRYLARTAFDGQQTDEPVSQDRPSNLFQPVPGDFGAHGEFSKNAKDNSWQWWITTHRGRIAITGLLLTVAVIGLVSWLAF